ncbi:hypothetical protein GCM10010193_20790 [Kitasatospora atroaurantiaca]|uniref:ATP-binding protein n=1 Tax=Kitasatospora atroaurantiaca TaxID=285545 RepID=A0A561EVA0_9ACTN|nr:ATP-binding protein [Kitasatospora atroaurantiaca]TWE19527.1 hypothetical protein FB465_4645 [Kitasatospora atroaurantiaca]
MGQPPGDFRQEGLRPRTGEVVSGELLLTVGTPDGSEARPCPDEWCPEPRRTGGHRPASASALGPSPAVGPLALGSAATDLPLLDREADTAQLLGLLAEGRSIRLVGQAGSGRSALLAAVADAAGGLAPDGVVRLSGHRRTAQDLLQDLFAATHRAPGFRPDPHQLPELLAGVGAVVVIDDVEPSGQELEDLLATAPECAFLISVAPGSPLLPLGSRLEDHPVAGLSRPACLALTARLAGRQLDDAERAWAVDLWFESEGLPLRFVQAAALLRQRDVSVDALVAAQEDRHSVFGMVKEIEEPDDPAVLEGQLRRSVPLPSVAESAAPAVRLAEGLSESAKAVLRLALALGGECPTAPHLPALIDVGLGESALHELTDCGLAVSIGGHHRLTAGVTELLTPHWEPGEIAYGAAQHFSWWVGHSSVSTEQIAAEAEVVLGALLADRAAGRPEAVLQLARAAAPALALSLRWGAWERALQLGLEAARSTGSAVDEAWFHHELGVLGLCVRTTERATAELEAAVALRAALGEPRGSAAARRMLNLLRADTKQLTAGDPEPSAAGRRPVMRAIAQVPWRFRTTPGTGGGTSRTVLAAAAAVLALGVLGTAVGLSLAGPESSGPGQTQPGGSLDDGSLSGDLNLGTRSPSPSASDSASADESASDSPSTSASSSRTSKKPTATKSSSGSPSDTPSQPPTKPSQAPSSTKPAPPTSSSPAPSPSTTAPTDPPTSPSP